jgi:hypothetical protein
MCGGWGVCVVREPGVASGQPQITHLSYAFPVATMQSSQLRLAPFGQRIYQKRKETKAGGDDQRSMRGAL